MNSCRTFAGILYVCGALSFVIGLEKMSTAQGCFTETYTSAVCEPAHTGEPSENGSGSYCEWVGNDCQATADTECVDRWGHAYGGECIYEALGSIHTHTCYAGDSQTFVNVKWYTASCEQNGGNCNCHWEATTTTQPLSVCECRDVENQN